MSIKIANLKPNEPPHRRISGNNQNPYNLDNPEFYELPNSSANVSPNFADPSAVLKSLKLEIEIESAKKFTATTLHSLHGLICTTTTWYSVNIAHQFILYNFNYWIGLSIFYRLTIILLTLTLILTIFRGFFWKYNTGAAVISLILACCLVATLLLLIFKEIYIDYGKMKLDDVEIRLVTFNEEFLLKNLMRHPAFWLGWLSFILNLFLAGILLRNEILIRRLNKLKNLEKNNIENQLMNNLTTMAKDKIRPSMPSIISYKGFGHMQLFDAGYYKNSNNKKRVRF